VERVAKGSQQRSQISARELELERRHVAAKLPPSRPPDDLAALSQLNAVRSGPSEWPGASFEITAQDDY